MLYIFRCKSHATLSIVDAMEQENIDAIVPTWTEVKRLPRSKKRVTIERPFLPSFIFIPPKCYAAAYTFGRHPAHLCSPFMVFGTAGRTTEEEVSRVTLVDSTEDKILQKGQTCVVTDGPFTGWYVIVCRFDGTYYDTHCKKTNLTLKIPSFMLRPEAL